MRAALCVIALTACGDNLAGPADAMTDPTGDGAVSPLELVASWGGLGTAPGQFIEPSSVELDGAGYVYVAGHENRFQKFTPGGELVQIIGTAGVGTGQFNHPHGLAIDRARGDLVFVGDQENHRIQVFAADGTFQRLWTSIKFQHIHDVGIDVASGDVFIGDYELDVLQRFTSSGQLVADLGGSGTGPGQFDGIWGISTDVDGFVYVADTFNRRVQKLTALGAFVAEWRDPGGVPFVKPTGVFVDARGLVYVCDSLAETIVVFARDGTVRARWHLREVLGEASEPEDIVIDATGDNIYVVEVRNHRVHRLRPRAAP